MRKILLILLSIPLLVSSQNFLTTPIDFDRQTKQSFIDKINYGEAQINTYSNKSAFWIVYADRSDIQLKNTPAGANIRHELLDFMEELYVKNVAYESGKNWLHVYT